MVKSCIYYLYTICEGMFVGLTDEQFLAEVDARGRAYNSAIDEWSKPGPGGVRLSLEDVFLGFVALMYRA